MVKAITMTVKGQEIRVTQHGVPDPKLVRKAYERLISDILREYEDKERARMISSFAAER